MGTELQTTDQSKLPPPSIGEFLEANRQAFLQVLPAHVGIDRMLRVTLSVLQRSADLQKCTQASLLNVLMQTMQLGLEPTGRYGGAWIVPFKDATSGLVEATAIYDYRGMMTIARRSGDIEVFDAAVVYESDYLDYERGLTPKLVHRPSMEKERGPLKAVYAIVRFKSGGYQMELMTRADVDAIRSRSKARDKGPWVTDYDRMAIKSVIRRICNLLPYSVELSDMIAADDEAEGHGSDDDRPARRGVTGLGGRQIKVVPEPEAPDAASGAPSGAEPAKVSPEKNEEAERSLRADLASQVQSGATLKKVNGAWLKAKIKAREGSIVMTPHGKLDLAAQPSAILSGLLEDLEKEHGV